MLIRLLLVVLSGCAGKDGGPGPSDTGHVDTAPPGHSVDDTAAPDDSGPGDTQEVDLDGDGAGAEVDCDDGDAGVYPGAEEIAYDGVDQDCDGADLTDVDGDGADGEPAGGSDCDDTDPTIAPGLYDLPGDGVDQDCDGADAWRAAVERALDSAAVTLVGGATTVLGWSVLLGVDHDGDGQDDVVLGDPSDHGRVYLFPGADGGVETEAVAVLSGEEDNHNLGLVLERAGDINRDGYADFWIGTGGGPYGIGEYANRFYLVEGPVPAEVQSIFQGSAAIVYGNDADDFLGSALSGGVDVDGDEVPDVLVSSARSYPWLITEADTLNDGELLGEVYTARLAAAKASAIAGDVNGDGLQDFVTGANLGEEFSGYAMVYYGPVYGLYEHADADVALEGPPEDAGGSGSSHYLDAVHGAGDVDGDGYSDLLLGASLYTNPEAGEVGTGVTYLVLGVGLENRAVKDADATYLPSSGSLALGTALDCGDFDGDGFSDVVFSAVEYADVAETTEHVFVFYNPFPGSYSASEADVVFTATGAEREFWPGYDLSVGDHDQDGQDDLLIGAPNLEVYDEGSGETTSPGGAYLFYGAEL